MYQKLSFEDNLALSSLLHVFLLIENADFYKFKENSFSPVCFLELL